MTLIFVTYVFPSEVEMCVPLTRHCFRHNCFWVCFLECWTSFTKYFGRGYPAQGILSTWPDFSI